VQIRPDYACRFFVLSAGQNQGLLQWKMGLAFASENIALFGASFRFEMLTVAHLNFYWFKISGCLPGRAQGPILRELWGPSKLGSCRASQGAPTKRRLVGYVPSGRDPGSTVRLEATSTPGCVGQTGLPQLAVVELPMQIG